MVTTKRMRGPTKSRWDMKNHVKKLSKKSDTSGTIKPLTDAEKELFSTYIMPPYKRPLNKHEKRIHTINERAVKALHEGNKGLFTNIVLETRALHVRDDAVRVAAEVGWVDVAERLLIRETTTSYQYPIWTAPLSIAFVRFNDNCDVNDPKGRWLLKTAVLSAVKNGKEDVFNLLVPIVGLYFTDFRRQNAIAYVSTSRMDMDIKKKWLDLIVKHIDQSSPQPLLEDAIFYLGQLQLTEHIPYLLSCLFSTGRAPSSQVMVALTVAITNRQMKVAHCIIDGFEKAAVPIHDRLAMYNAESSGDIDLVLRLHRNGCHSFPVRLYGASDAQNLRKLLSTHGHENLHPPIVLE